jgi:hypothetical protein
VAIDALTPRFDVIGPYKDTMSSANLCDFHHQRHSSRVSANECSVFSGYPGGNDAPLSRFLRQRRAHTRTLTCVKVQLRDVRIVWHPNPTRPMQNTFVFIMELVFDYGCCFPSPDIATAAQDASLPAHTSTSRTAFVVSEVLQLPYHALWTIYTAPPDQEKEPQI